MNKSQTLVSVVVITYNSSAFVLETLESARKQTYDQVELIITDDGSTDETISLCKEWLEINSARFIRVALLTVKENTGIPANCNRGVKAAKGEWVKLIAGDDILHENCITLNMEYVDKPEFAPCVVLSDMLQFSNSLDTEDTLKRIVPTNIEILTDNIASSIQHKYMLKHYIGNSPSMFISKLLLDEIPYDEEIRFMEDRPFAINLTARGFVFRYFKEVTVYYRISEQSVYASKAGNVLYNDFYKKRRPFVTKYLYPTLSSTERALNELEFRRLSLLDSLSLNRNNLICRAINYVTLKLNPYSVYRSCQTWKESKPGYWMKGNR